MARLNWDTLDNRFFEAGVDRGVLYPAGGFGVVWNGLINVTTDVTDIDTEPYYMDGLKVRHDASRGEITASIEAFMYPDEFMACEGYENLNNGLYAGQQDRQMFNLTYRTLLGSSDSTSVGDRYRIHILYNALATPAQRSNQTLGEDIEPSTFSWDITTLPENVRGLAPTSHFVVDSSELSEYVLMSLEDLIYGSPGTSPQLPSGQHLVDFLESWTGLGIEPNLTTGIAKLTNVGPNDDLNGDLGTGLFTRDPDSRLTPTTIPGLYRLE